MMQACPHCGSTDIVTVEIGENEADCVYECEACAEQYNGDEAIDQ